MKFVDVLFVKVHGGGGNVFFVDEDIILDSCAA
jgi:prepilin-type processing-associated H-X9-DG protein